MSKGNSRGMAASASLVVLAAALLATGWWQSSGVPGSPRVKVLSGEVLVGGEPLELESVLAAGTVLSLCGDGAAVTLKCPRGESITITGRARFRYLGATRRGHRYELDHGRLFVRGIAPGSAVSVRNSLGNARLATGVHEVVATAMPTGSAIDTPRVFRVTVAEGSARLAAAGGSAVPMYVPSGIKALVTEGSRQVRIEGYLLPGEWEKLLGRRVLMGDAGLPAAGIPSGAWIPRRPGSRGPTPGSRAGITMRFSAGLGRGVLRGKEGETWLYDCAGDRWSRAEKPISIAVTGAPPRPQPPTGSGQGGAVAYSPRAGLFVYYGEVDGVPGTWICRREGRLWTRLAPAANPPPRVGHALYYDAVADVFVLYGGQKRNRTRGDVWILRL